MTDRMMRSHRRILVLDDDPTGSQTAAGVPIATDFSAESIEWALREAAPTAFVLTNARALDENTTRELTRSIARTATTVAERLGLALSIVSRSDSTLRGHFPVDVDVLTEVSAAGTPHVLVLCPAYPAAGRITREGRHLVRSGPEWVPVGETAYARDATFGFSASTLPHWVHERSRGRWAAADVTVVSGTDIRLGPDHVSRLIGATAALDPNPVCVDAETESDLDVVAAALEQCEDNGIRTIVRCGPSLARARGGLPHSDRISTEHLRAALDPTTGPHGLVVAGSHVDLTTTQLRYLDQLDRVSTVELSTTDVVDRATRVAAIDRAVTECVSALALSDVVLRTSRDVVVGSDEEDSLSIAAAVAHALSTAASAVVAAAPPRWVVAKGGITSADVITKVLCLRRATVLGPILDGIVPVWVPESSSGPLCVVFPGNVGGPEALRDVVTVLRELN
ncbi:four-carbon acid sugar kinase family protein [Rhodococcus sp. NPDC057529]|uniref:four-carbon acid sugar kinase family protein n=1 Tax=Rhodococcus sp. NPDC057529 TaxID=3346158 RepID=UPI00366CE8FC